MRSWRCGDTGVRRGTWGDVKGRGDFRCIGDTGDGDMERREDVERHGDMERHGDTTGDMGGVGHTGDGRHLEMEA